MKTPILKTTMALVVMSTTAFAQNKKAESNKAVSEKEQIPEVVIKAFKKDFPTVKKTDWGKEGNLYEAEFEVNKQEMSATYNLQGKKVEVETEISMNKLPKKALDYINHQKLGSIKEASKIEITNGKTEYEAEIGKKDYIFDSNGNFLSIK